MSFQDYLRLIQSFISIALILQSLEQLALNPALKNGPWRWVTLSKDFKTSIPGFNFLFEKIIPHPGFSILRIIAAVTILINPHWVLAVFLFLSSYLLILRWRGNFNGGSDHMTLIVLGALSIVYLFPESPLALGALLYVGIQSVISYFIGGWVKITKINWRKGLALKRFIQLSSYRPSVITETITCSPLGLIIFSWVGMLFELSAPLALFSPGYLIPFLSMAFIFHLLNFYLFGLNRFVFVWISTYPAIALTAHFLSTKF